MLWSHVSTLTFDCFGTLIDWESGLSNALGTVLLAHGLALPREAVLELYGELEAEIEAEPYRSYRGVLEESVRRLGKRLGFSPTEREVAALPASLAHWPAFPDTAAALLKLKSRFRLAVVSNIDDDLFAGCRPHLGVELDGLVTAQQVGVYKPSPLVFGYALGKLGCSRGEVVHVAQSLYHDIAPAKALGFRTVWVNRRSGKVGSGATPPAISEPDLEVPDLATLAELALA